ncbi:MAG: ComF family protein [Chthoniobacterales bacterium]
MKWPHFTDILFLKQCIICKTRGDAICCATCLSRIPVSTAPPAKWLSDPDSGKHFCYFAASADYENKTVKTLIHALKFDFIKSAAEPLGALLTSYTLRYISQFRTENSFLNNFFTGNANIVPIPLSKKRERHRGFNQSELIARHFARNFARHFGRSMDIPVRNDVLLRIRHTKPQSETTSAEERREHMHGCFSAKIPPSNIILIDDVATTGSTLREAAIALRAAGAEKILAFAVASVPLTAESI